MQVLKIEGLNKSFGGLKAIVDLSFEVEEGRIIGLIGPNGSGKTTTLNLLTGALKPDSGTVTFMGEDITGLSRPKIASKGIGRTFQIVRPFLEFTVLENVMVGRSFGKEPAPSMKIAAAESEELLDRVGLLSKAKVQAKNLTLMQRKRMELARALAVRPHLLLLDELMAGLNPGETEQAMALIKQIRDDGVTILVIEHIVKAILGLSDCIVVLNMGAKIAEGLPQEVIHNPDVIDVYLGKPHA